MSEREEVTTIREAAEEFGLNRMTFRRRTRRLGIEPSADVPRCPAGKGFTPEQMEQLREALRPAGAPA